MKLATLKDGSRDGQLAVVSRDLSRVHFATGIAGTMQRLLDDWNFLSPQLEDLYATLNDGKARHAFDFDPRRCMAPLPRAFQWVDGSAYLNHVILVRKARMAELADAFVAMPGGYGTLEELFEVVTWAQIGYHHKPIGLLNVAGFYNPLLAMIDHGIDEGFIRPGFRNLLVSAETAGELMDLLSVHEMPASVLAGREEN